VTSHEAWGLGIYSVFNKSDVLLTRAIEVPDVCKAEGDSEGDELSVEQRIQPRAAARRIEQRDAWHSVSAQLYGVSAHP
jgi:hypothetical protein